MFNKETKNIKVYNLENETAFSSVSTLLKDAEGNIWAGSKSGVMRTHGDEIEFIDQLGAGITNNVLALTTDQQGRIWFANRDGLFTYQMEGGIKLRVAKCIQKNNL